MVSLAAAQAPSRPRPGSLPRALPAVVLLAVAPLLLGGCAARRSGGAEAGPRPLCPEPGPDLPWQLPADAVGTQRLFRVAYNGPEGSGVVRLTLRLASRERFQAAAADRFGRPLWSLEMEAAGGLWLDHRAATFCAQPASFELTFLPVPGVGLEMLPQLLLGRLPVRAAAAGAHGGEVRDSQGRRWTAERDADGLAAWTLWGPRGPAWWWRRDGRGGVLSQRGAGRQLRWSETAVEALAPGLAPLRVPDGFTPSCEAPAAPPEEAVSGRPRPPSGALSRVGSPPPEHRQLREPAVPL